MCLQIWPPAWAKQGKVINMDRSALASSAARKHASTPQSPFALHIYKTHICSVIHTQ